MAEQLGIHRIPDAENIRAARDHANLSLSLTPFCFRQESKAQKRRMTCPRSHEFEAEPGLELTSHFLPSLHVLGSTPT